ncbi:MAG: phosphoenolpyruvate--protein phosphotransferase [Bifidobacterium sp.]|nr:phosphoenolpyruvate--protein phosphotransferase [Bifidobacterium sp.]
MVITGVGIGRGIAMGPVLRMPDPIREPSSRPRSDDTDAATEVSRVDAALARVREDLERRADAAAHGDGGARQAASILTALAQMTDDPALHDSIVAGIGRGLTAQRAVFEGFGGFEAKLSALGGYMSERSADLHDIGQRVMADLLHVQAPGIPHSERPFVLVATDLSPADTAALDPGSVLAIVTSQGGPTSHTAILARARSIVAVVSAARAADLVNGDNVIVNAASGTVSVNPTDEEVSVAREAKARADRAKGLRGLPGGLADGTAIPLLANVARPQDAGPALEYGAEGVGLFRTEFLFIANGEPPGVEEQTREYTKLLERFPGRKVVIRVLDAGADKPLPFLTPENEPNPALGLRGLRSLKAHRQVLDDQLEALSRADRQTRADLWVMAPMVADQYEAAYFVTLAKSKGLRKVGVMAEVPSIAFMADEVAAVADFVSIGTNDLTQYTMAADRTLGSVSGYQNAWHPAVLRAIKLIADAGVRHGMPVGVCGEAAADPDLAVVLVGLGVNSLSMSPAALDDVRAELAGCTLEQARSRATRALRGDFYHPSADPHVEPLRG